MRIKTLLFAASAVVLGAVAWLAVSTVDAQYEKDVERALRSMDRRLDLILAAENRRPATDYVAFAYLETDAYTRSFKKLQKNQVRIPSPLLTHKPEFVQLHFQIDGEGRFSSPQVPTSNAKDIQDRVKLGQQAKAHFARMSLSRVKVVSDDEPNAFLSVARINQRRIST